MRMRKPLSTLVLLALAAAAPARAASFDVPAGPLADALDTLARQGELQILFDRASLAGNASAGLKGEYEPRAALQRLLDGSGLKATMTADNAAAVSPLPPIAGKPAVESAARIPQTLPEMQITAIAEPAGYSVPSVAAATRTETPLEHVPQSVVVLPKALFNDQGAMTLSDALRNVASRFAAFPPPPLSMASRCPGCSRIRNRWPMSNRSASSRGLRAVSMAVPKA
jgi:iron complex outermembrane receptor protein